MSRIDNEVREILAIEDLGGAKNNANNFSTAPTIHSQEEEQNKDFPILNTIYSQQIFNTNYINK